MSATELPRFDDDFRDAFNLKTGLVPRCREALSGDGRIAGFERTRLALLELGCKGSPGDVELPAFTAAEDTRRVLQTVREGGSVPAARELWRVPVAAGVHRLPGGFDPLSADGRARVGWLELLGLWLNGTFPDQGLDVEMPVLMRLGSEGEVATLRLRALDEGPPGLYPHPSMALFYGDPAFRASVAHAWGAVAVRTHTVTWEVRTGDRAIDHVFGGSAGGAFAVALAHLHRGQTRRLARALGVRSRAAISAGVRADASLSPVVGREEKLDAAAEAGLKLVVLASEDHEGGRDGNRTGVRVRFAADVQDAVRLTRARVSRVTAAAAVLLLAAALTVAVLAVQNHRSAVRTERERLARVADELLSKAASVGRDDRQLQDKLLLAATSLAQGAHDQGLAERALNQGSTLEPGVLNRLELPLAGPVDGLVAVDDGQGIIAWSESGHLTLVEASSGRQLGNFVQPPGISSLFQPIPRASAALPGSGLAAFVFQNPLRSAADRRATLVIFSTEGALRAIGTAHNFTSLPTAAVGYAPSGTRLLTVSGSDLTVWDVTAATPTELSTCRWRPPGSRAKGSAIQIIALDQGHPGLVLDRGQIIRLGGWEPSSGSCQGRLIAPALPRVAPQDFVKQTLATGKTAHGRIIQLGVRRDGAIAVRPLGGPATVLHLDSRATGIGPLHADQVPVQTADGSLRVFDVAGRQVKPANSYRRHALPAAVGPQYVYASQGGRVTQLSTAEETYPAATLEFGHGQQLVNGVAMTEHAVALAYPTGAAVLGVDDRRLDRAVTWPDGWQLAAGDGRFNETLSLSGSGRYLAAVLSARSRGRQLLLYDTTLHTPIDIRRQLRRYTTLGPLDVAFERGGERLLVEYYNGLLVRLSPTASGWNAEALLRGQVDKQAFGLTLSDEGIFRIETSGGRGRVARYDEDGSLRATWSLAGTRATLGLTREAEAAQLAVMDDSRAALVLDAGMAFQLRAGGRLGPPLSLGDGPVLDTAQIGADELLVGRRSGTSTLHWRAGVVEDSTKRLGPLHVIAAAPKFDLLAASTLLTAETVIMPLRSNAQTAQLCDSADGDLSPAAWQHFVGASVAYRPLCEALGSQSRALGWLVFRSRQLPEPIGLRTPTVAEVGSLDRVCAARGTTPPAWVASSRADAPSVVCVHGRATWVASGTTRPHAVTGGTPTQPLLLVGGPARDGPPLGTNISDLVDSSGNVVAEFIAHGGAAGLVGEHVAVTERVGDLLLTTTYGRDPRGAGWTARQELPAGTAVPPGHP